MPTVLHACRWFRSVAECYFAPAEGVGFGDASCPACVQVFERETNREKNLEKAVKEAKVKARKEAAKTSETDKDRALDEQDILKVFLHTLYIMCHIHEYWAASGYRGSCHDAQRRGLCFSFIYEWLT